MKGHTDNSLPLVTFNPSTSLYEINQQALSFIKSIPGPIGVVSMVGLYRTGKSYLLNHVLLQRPKGFNVGPTVNPCTKGIWVWGTPIPGKSPEGKPMNILVIDTEGIGALDEDSNHDTKIFSLAVLLSSLFIYNSVGSIDENAIQNLSLIVSLTKHIQFKASHCDEEIDENELASYFPTFLWIIRDFTLRLEDQEGYEITSKEYLEQSLKVQPGFSDDVEQKNRIRRLLQTFFQQRDCFTMVRPIVDENDLQHLSEMPSHKLRPEFTQQCQQVRKHIFGQVPCKKLQNTEITGKELGNLLESYIESINKGGIPNIESSWNYCIREASQQSYQRAIQNFKLNLDRISLPLQEEQLKQKIVLIQEDALKEYKEGCLEAQNDLEELLEDIRKKKIQIYQTNKQLIYKTNQKYIEHLYHEKMRGQDNYFENLKDLYRMIQNNLPVKSACGQERLIELILQEQALGSHHDPIMEEQYEKLSQNLIEKNQCLEQQSVLIKDYEKNLKEKIVQMKQMRVQNDQIQKDLLQTQEYHKQNSTLQTNELIQTQSKLKDLERKHELEMTSLQRSKEQVEQKLKHQEGSLYDTKYLNGVKNLIQQLEEQIQDLKQKYQEFEKINLKQNQIQYNKMQQELQDQIQLVQKMNLKTQQMKQEYDSIIIEKNDIVSKLTNDKQAFIHLQKDHDQLKQDFSEKMKKTNINYQQQIDTLNLRIIDQDKQIHELTYELSDKIQNEEQLNKLASYESMEQKMLLEQQTMKQQYEDTIFNLKQEVIQISHNYEQEKQSIIARDQKQKYVYEEKIKKMSDHMTIYKDSNQYENEAINYELKETKESLQMAKSEYEKNEAISQQKISFQEIQIKEYKRQLEEYKNSLDTAVESLQKNLQNETQQDYLNNLNHKKHLSALEDQVQQYQDQIMILQKKLVEEQNSLFQTKITQQNSDTLAKSLQSQLVILENQKKAQQKQFEQQEDKINQLNSQLESQREFASMIEDKIKDEASFLQEKEIQELKDEYQRHIQKMQNDTQREIELIENHCAQDMKKLKQNQAQLQEELETMQFQFILTIFLQKKEQNRLMDQIAQLKEEADCKDLVIIQQQSSAKQAQHNYKFQLDHLTNQLKEKDQELQKFQDQTQEIHSQMQSQSQIIQHRVSSEKNFLEKQLNDQSRIQQEQMLTIQNLNLKLSEAQAQVQKEANHFQNVQKSLNHEIEALKNQKIDIQSSFEKDIILWKQKCTFLEQQKIQSKQDHEEAVKKFDYMLNNLGSMRKEQESDFQNNLKDTLKELERKYQNQIENLQDNHKTEVQRLQKKIVQLQDRQNLALNENLQFLKNSDQNQNNISQDIEQLRYDNQQLLQNLIISPKYRSSKLRMSNLSISEFNQNNNFLRDSTFKDSIRGSFVSSKDYFTENNK